MKIIGLQMIRYFIIVVLMLFQSSVAAQNFKRPDSYNYTRGVEAIQNDNLQESLDYLNKEVRENPENGYAYSWLALVYSYYEEYGRALTAADKALKFIPKKDKEYRSFVLSVRAEVYRELGQDSKAMQDYNQAVKETPDDVDVYEQRAQMFYEQKQYDLADADYRKIIALDQGNVVGYMGLGRNMNARERYAEAIEQFDYVIKLAPEYSSGYSFRAESYIGLRQYAKAADDIVKALSIDGDDMAFYYMRVMADSALVEMTAKLKIQATKNPNNVYWPYCLGIVYETVAWYAEAIEYYKTSLAKEPYAVTFNHVANCYDEMGDYNMALEYIDQALSMDSARYSYLNAKANILDNAGRTAEAIETISKYIEYTPESFFGYYCRGWMKDHSGDIDGAIEDYTMAIALEPDYAYAYLNRGKLYRLQGKEALAKADFIQVIEIDTIPGYNNTAQYAFYYLGDKEKAIDFMNRALEQEDKGNYYDAACLHSIMGEKETAIAYLRKALESGFRRFAHIARDSDLNNIREEEEFKALINEFATNHEKEVEARGEISSNYEEVSTEIPFTKEGGVCIVKCTINDLPLHFIFDTGASDVSLSSVEASFMMKNGYLKSTDVVGRQNYMNANGEISEGTVINIRSVNFGELHLDNIKASVVKNQSAPLLLGQSVLARLGKIEIDNENQVIKVTYRKPVK